MILKHTVYQYVAVNLTIVIIIEQRGLFVRKK